MTLDDLITEFDRGLRSITGVTRMARPMPQPTPVTIEVTPDGEAVPAGSELTPAERAHAAGLMRVNHVGEVCAQALYQAQKMSTRSPSLKVAFDEAAREEEDHLAWTSRRLQALDSRPSRSGMPAHWRSASPPGVSATR